MGRVSTRKRSINLSSPAPGRWTFPSVCAERPAVEQSGQRGASRYTLRRGKQLTARKAAMKPSQPSEGALEFRRRRHPQRQAETMPYQLTEPPPLSAEFARPWFNTLTACAVSRQAHARGIQRLGQKTGRDPGEASRARALREGRHPIASWGSSDGAEPAGLPPAVHPS